MLIKSEKDFFSGLMFTIVGGAFAFGATTYNIGTGARMGPGYFPLLLGIVLAILGMIITAQALISGRPGGDKIGAFAWRPLCFIIGANLVYARVLSNDWAWGWNGTPYTYGDNTTVNMNQSQSMTYLGVTYTYKF